MASIELTTTVKQLKSERERVAKALSTLDGAISALQGLIGGGVAATATKHRRTRPGFTAAARRRMSLAQKARWAAKRTPAATAASTAPHSSRVKPVFPAAARRRISVAQKARWAAMPGGGGMRVASAGTRGEGKPPH